MPLFVEIKSTPQLRSNAKLLGSSLQPFEDKQLFLRIRGDINVLQSWFGGHSSSVIVNAILDIIETKFGDVRFRIYLLLGLALTWIVLPSHNHEILPSAFPAKEVTKVALRLKYQIEQVIPCELEEWKITTAHSSVITHKVIKTAKEAGGQEYGACVIYGLLVCKKWFKRQANLELWDSDLHHVRAVACEVIAKQMYVP